VTHGEPDQGDRQTDALSERDEADDANYALVASKNGAQHDQDDRQGRPLSGETPSPAPSCIVGRRHRSLKDKRRSNACLTIA
jgi:hypothetical protein